MANKKGEINAELRHNAAAASAADTEDTPLGDPAAPPATPAVPQDPKNPKRRLINIEAGSELSAKAYKKLGYTDNSIRSYKYEWVFFLPQNLFEQFHRLANCYFLLIVIICLIPPLTPQTYLTSLMPLVLVLAVQALKDGMEDYKRHRSDEKDNTSPARVIRNGNELDIKRQEVRVGDILIIEQPEDGSGAYVSADCILLATVSIPDADTATNIEANAKGLCYINTKQLDGETNLKMFQAKPETAKFFKSTGDFGNLSMKLDVEGPGHENSGNLYKFSGKVEWSEEKDPMIVNLDQLLLRGQVMEQTHTAWGLVINTGMQTKIQMNLAGEKPYKISSMEEMLNKQVILVFFMLGVCVLTCGIGLGIWLNDNGSDSWYIYVDTVNGVPATWDSNSELFGVGVFEPDDAATCGVYGFFTFIVVLSTFVPISLYVTIEMIKFVTGQLIDWDMNMWSEDLVFNLGGIEYDEDNKWDGHSILDMESYKMGFAKCKSSKLVEQLGQVQYVLSDKTGTLTRNKMELCKIGVCCDTDDKPDAERPSHEFGEGISEIEGVRARLENRVLKVPEKPSEALKYESTINKHHGGTFEFYDHRLNAISQNGEYVFPFMLTPDAPATRAMKKVLLSLALCHTVFPQKKEQKDENDHVDESKSFIKYNAASPDDGALVKAALNFGYELTSRSAEENDKDHVGIRTKKYVGPGNKMADIQSNYIIHATFDADSVRKRMTVIAEGEFDGEEKIMIITKGADSIVGARCACVFPNADTKFPHDLQAPPPRLNCMDDVFPPRPPDEEIETDKKNFSKMTASTNKFSDLGLRSFMVAQAELPREKLDEFLKLYADAKADTSDAGKDRMAEIENRIEYNLRPLGCVAIEDKLQLNVGRCLKRLGESGIQTWVLTGDKVQTAIEIGYACNLLNKDHTIVRQLLAKDENGSEQTIDGLCAELDLFEEQFERKVGIEENDDKKMNDDQTMSLVIEGDALLKFGIGWTDKMLHEQEDTDLKAFIELRKKRCRLIEFAGRMKSCICCRVSPKQKGDVTKLVKEVLQKVCLGIGDGANDVEMILQGNVGVGVQGVEGSQAVNNSDFAITEFQHLENLLLVHGRWTYQRIAISVCYFFYKNIAFTMCVFWFACFSAFSGQLFFEAWSASCYNVFFTSIPVLVFGLMNQDIGQEIARNCPKLYAPGQESAYLNYQVFSWWIAEAIYASVIMFFFGYAAIADQVEVDGRVYDHWSLSTTVYTACVISMTMRIALETSYFTWITHVTYWGSIFVWFLYCFITCGVGVLGLFGYIPGYSYQYWLIFQMMQSGAFYLYVALIPVAVTLPAYTWVAVQACYFPSLTDMCRDSRYHKALVMAEPPLMDQSMVELSKGEKKTLRDRAKKEKDRQNLTRGSKASDVLARAPMDAYDGMDMNQALWSGRKNLTGKEAIRKAARQVLLKRIQENKLKSRGGLSSSSQLLAASVLAAKDKDKTFSASERGERMSILRASQEAAAAAEAEAAAAAESPSEDAAGKH
jgi:magnesium-transporting ATPase (P-type)